MPRIGHRTRITTVIAVACLLAVISVGGTAVAAVADADGGATADVPLEQENHRSTALSASFETATAARETAVASADRTIQRTQELRLTPERPGEIDVRVTFSIPDGVTQLRTTVSSRGTIAATDGFVKQEGNEYAWDRRTSTPTLTYRLSVNETRDVDGPIAGKGEYTFVDAGEWALLRVPSTSASWSWTGETVGFSRATTTAGPGEVGEAIAFLGENRVVTRNASGQTFRLVVPDRATLADSPSRILDSMAEASGALQVGDRDETVFAVAAPTESVQWGVRGIQTGDADMWVRDVDRVDTADNVWLHEYVHTRQDFVADDEIRWFTEASASYYAALLTLEQDRTSFESFRDRLRLGTRSPDRDAILVDPSTWNSIAPYTKGALVAGDLDRRIRDATSRRHSLQDVLGRMNGYEGTVTRESFTEILRAASNDSVVGNADRFTTTSGVPDVWDIETHSRSFSTLPARIGYRIAGTDSDGFAVSGPYRNGTTGSGEPVRLATGETLTVDAVAENEGGTTGEYDFQLLVDGEVKRHTTGTLPPGESRTLSLSHRFDRAGEYALSVGGHTVPVSVRRPGSPTVGDLRIEERGATDGAGASTRLTATLANDGPYPAAANLTLLRGEAVVDSRRIGVGPGAQRSISHESADLDPGEYVYRLGDRTAEFAIENDTSTPARGRGTGSVPVAIVAVVALAIVVTASLAALRRRP